MRKRIGFVWMVVMVLSIASLIGTGKDAAARQSGKYISDISCVFSEKTVVPALYRNRSPQDLDNWDLIEPDASDGGDIDLEGDMAFAYAKVYVKRTDDPNKAIRDLQVRTDYDDRSGRNLKDVNKKSVLYDSILPQNLIYNMLYMTHNKTSGDPIQEVFFFEEFTRV